MSRRVEIERESRSPVKLNKKYKIQIFVYIWLFECLYYFTWEDRHCHTSDIEECRCDVCWVVDAEADGDDDDDAGHHVDGQAPEVHEAEDVNLVKNKIDEVLFVKHMYHSTQGLWLKTTHQCKYDAKHDVDAAWDASEEDEGGHEDASHGDPKVTV